MTIYEESAERLRRHTDHALISAVDVVAVAAAVWDAIYACPQCDGSRHDQAQFCPASAWVEEGTAKPNEVGCHPCPAEHVVLTNPHSGEERYCKPDMAEWVDAIGCSIECARGTHVERCRWRPIGYEGNNK